MINWLLTNINTIFQIIGIAGLVCSCIVKIFSNKPWAKWFVKICDYLSVVNTAENQAIITAELEKRAKKKSK